MLLRLRSIPRRPTYPACASIRSLYSTSCQKKNEKSTSEFCSLPQYSLRDELYIPSTQINTLLFEFKHNLSKIDDQEVLIKTFVSTVTELSRNTDTNGKFQKLINKIRPVLIDTLLKIKDVSTFVNLFVTLSLLNIKIDDSKITGNIRYILNSPNVALIEKYKLITCNLDVKQNQENFTLSFLRAPLSVKQTQAITNSYSTDVIKSIISFYLPLKDSKKIDEFFGILLSIDKTNTVKQYKTFVDLILNHTKLDLKISKNSNLFHICTELSLFTKYCLEIPSDFSTDTFHEIFITEYLQDINSKVLYHYITAFYGDKLPSQFDPIKKGNEYKPINPDIMKSLSSLVSTNEIPMSIQGLLLSRFVDECDVELNKVLIEKFRTSNPSKELLSVFKFSILKHALERYGKRTYFEYLMEFIHDDEIILPEFDEVDIKSMFDYYKFDFEGFLEYLETVNRTQASFKYVNTELLRWIINSVDLRKKERIVLSILKNNIIPTDNSIVKEWYRENQKLINYTLTDGSLDPNTIHPDNVESVSLFRLLTLIRPRELLDLVSEFGSEIYYHGPIFSLLRVYKPDFEYICAQLRVLPIIKGKNANSLEQLIKFMKNNNVYDKKVFTEDQRFRLYNIYCENILNIGYYSGLITACNLIPSFKTEITKLTGITDVHLIEADKSLVLKGDYKLPIPMIKCFIKSYANQKNMCGRLWVAMFKSTLNVGSTIEDAAAKEQFYEYVFKYFQTISITKKYGPISLCKLYQVAESNKLNPEWKINVNMSKVLEQHYENEENLKDTKDTISFVISTVAKYESNLELSGSLVYKLFNNIKPEESLFFLVSLRNLVLKVPFATNVHRFLHEQFNDGNADVYKLFGLEMENLLLSNPKCKRAKWMRFDIRYFAPLLEIFMKDIISKDHNVLVNQMMMDSISNMKWGDDGSEKNMKFYNFYHHVAKFGKTEKSTGSFKSYLDEYNVIFDANRVDIPDYLFKPFVYHFFYTRIFSYDLETIMKMVYILNRGDTKLGEFGYWDIIESTESLEKHFGISGKIYNVDDEAEFMKLYKLVFSAIKNSNNVSTKELTYIVNIAENLIKSEITTKKNKYWIMNCTFILMGKHSNLLNAFYKKMQKLLPDYKVPNSVITELLYSTMINYSPQLENVLDHLLESHDSHIMHQSSEVLIKRLIFEEHNGLAQLYFAKYTDRKPRFKVPSLPDTFSWSKAKAPTVTIDSNDGVNMKMDRFKVKLYDYDSLDKSKNQ